MLEGQLSNLQNDNYRLADEMQAMQQRELEYNRQAISSQRQQQQFTSANRINPKDETSFAK